MPFSSATRAKALLWSDRHCCLCKKPCGVDIEVHHIVPEGDGGDNDIGNAIPLCFTCHAKVHHYSQKAGLGTKFKPDELKQRRDQVYEEFTRHLVPPLHHRITQRSIHGSLRRFPDVGFQLQHFGDSLPVRVRTKLSIVSPIKKSGLGGHYSGKKLWRLNPRTIVEGHFEVPPKARPVAGGKPLHIEVETSVIDTYEREHFLLPQGYVYVLDRDWYLEP